MCLVCPLCFVLFRRFAHCHCAEDCEGSLALGRLAGWEADHAGRFHGRARRNYSSCCCTGKLAIYAIYLYATYNKDVFMFYVINCGESVSKENKA